ncbi:MAG: 50S ribosomal protein L9 [Candidatus Margulisiibacteriota bacterium]|nr:50S ribosomal protein L9 [Candidatus Margulisiibacteriota bacterium]
MKVVLRKELENLGEADSVVNVASGYARNFLIPRNLAVPATKGELAACEKREAKREKELEAKRAEFEELAKKISELEILITADAGEGGKLFGSVTAQDIAAALKDASGIEISKKKIEIKNPIKVIGDHIAQVKIYKEISAELKVKVEAKK